MVSPLFLLKLTPNPQFLVLLFVAVLLFSALYDVSASNATTTFCDNDADFLSDNPSCVSANEAALAAGNLTSWSELECDAIVSTSSGGEGPMWVGLMGLKTCCGGLASKVRCLDGYNMCKNSTDFQPTAKVGGPSCADLSTYVQQMAVRSTTSLQNGTNTTVFSPPTLRSWTNANCEEGWTDPTTNEWAAMDEFLTLISGSCCGGLTNVRCSKSDGSTMCKSEADFLADKMFDADLTCAAAAQATVRSTPWVREDTSLAGATTTNISNETQPASLTDGGLILRLVDPSTLKTKTLWNWSQLSCSDRYKTYSRGASGRTTHVRTIQTLLKSMSMCCRGGGVGTMCLDGATMCKEDGDWQGDLALPAIESSCRAMEAGITMFTGNGRMSWKDIQCSTPYDDGRKPNNNPTVFHALRSFAVAGVGPCCGSYQNVKCVEENHIAGMCLATTDFKPTQTELVFGTTCASVSVSLLQQLNKTAWADVSCNDGWWDSDNSLGKTVWRPIRYYLNMVGRTCCGSSLKVKCPVDHSGTNICKDGAKFQPGVLADMPSGGKMLCESLSLMLIATDSDAILGSGAQKSSWADIQCSEKLIRIGEPPVPLVAQTYLAATCCGGPVDWVRCQDGANMCVDKTVFQPGVLLPDSAKYGTSKTTCASASAYALRRIVNSNSLINSWSTVSCQIIDSTPSVFVAGPGDAVGFTDWVADRLAFAGVHCCGADKWRSSCSVQQARSAFAGERVVSQKLSVSMLIPAGSSTGSLNANVGLVQALRAGIVGLFGGGSVVLGDVTNVRVTLLRRGRRRTGEGEAGPIGGNGKAAGEEGGVPIGERRAAFQLAETAKLEGSASLADGIFAVDEEDPLSEGPSSSSAGLASSARKVAEAASAFSERWRQLSELAIMSEQSSAKNRNFGAAAIASRLMSAQLKKHEDIISKIIPLKLPRKHHACSEGGACGPPLRGPSGKDRADHRALQVPGSSPSSSQQLASSQQATAGGTAPQQTSNLELFYDLRIASSEAQAALSQFQSQPLATQSQLFVTSVASELSSRGLSGEFGVLGVNSFQVVGSVPMGGSGGTGGGAGATSTAGPRNVGIVSGGMMAAITLWTMLLTLQK